MQALCHRVSYASSVCGVVALLLQCSVPAQVQRVSCGGAEGPNQGGVHSPSIRRNRHGQARLPPVCPACIWMLYSKQQNFRVRVPTVFMGIVKRYGESLSFGCARQGLGQDTLRGDDHHRGHCRGCAAALPHDQQGLPDADRHPEHDRGVAAPATDSHNSHALEFTALQVPCAGASAPGMSGAAGPMDAWCCLCKFSACPCQL